MAKKQFKAESKRLLDLMIGSIYTHKEIFLREIISNASDACDKLCYRALTDAGVGMTREDFKIELTVDEENRTLTISDNGIGMSREDLENNLGVIAASGSYQFRQEIADKEADVDVIGQFGVGFYSAFMVADEIEVCTKKYGEESAFLWKSSGADGYTISACEKASIGTDILLHIKEDTADETYSRYLESRELQNLIKKYSDYIRYPIRMSVEKTRRKEDAPADKPEYESYREVETLNSMVPLWQRKKGEVTKEEYDKFYQSKFSDYTPPQCVITADLEGAVTMKALLFIPGATPYDFYSKDFQKGLQLYSGGVLIMENCADLLPEHFRFVRGVVDSPDLSLNISRELLQHDRQLKVIATALEKKIRAELLRLQSEDFEGYETFWKNFGRQIKYGVVGEYGAHKEMLQELLLFYSSTEQKLVTLKDYVSRMQEDQKLLYYAAGESLTALQNLPQMELLQERKLEILYFTDEADEFVANTLHEYDGKEFRSVVDGDLDLDGAAKEEDAPETGARAKVLSFVKDALGEGVAEVKISKKLKSHPVCLTAGEGLSFEMEKYFSSVQPDGALHAKRILELNAGHSAFAALERAMEENPEKAKKYAQLLYSQALLIAGLPLEDPAAYADLVCGLME